MLVSLISKDVGIASMTLIASALVFFLCSMDESSVTTCWLTQGFFLQEI